MSEWISVDERLPEFGSRVQVFDGRSVDIGNYADKDEIYPSGFWNDGFGSIYEDITHWMPLPEPPKEQPND